MDWLPLVVVILAIVAIVAAVVCAFFAGGEPFNFWDEHEQN